MVQEVWKMMKIRFVAFKLAEWYARNEWFRTNNENKSCPPVAFWAKEHKDLVHAAVFLRQNVPLWVLHEYKEEPWAQEALDNIF